MRELIKQGLATIATSGERTLAEQLSARLVSAKATRPAKVEAAAKGPAANRGRGAKTRAQGSARKPRELVAAG